MSQALADFLIELSHPEKLSAYREDPDLAIKRAKLSAADAQALRSEDALQIQLQIQETDNPGDGVAQKVTAILNGALTLPPVVITWPPPKWIATYTLPPAPQMLTDGA